MNFSDEPYVRVYKRRTTTMAVVGWHARAVLRELFLVVDRAGVLDLDDEDPADAVTAVVGDIPVDVIRDALEKLQRKGCIQINGRYLVIPKFREAQETPASDRLRSRESRERRRESAMRDQTDTVSHEASHDVTNRDAVDTSCDDTDTTGHDASRAVTQSRAEQSRAEQGGAGEPRQPRAKRSRPIEPKFEMHQDWQPSSARVDAIAVKHGIPIDALRRQVPEFRVYWMPGGKGYGRSAVKTQFGWDQTYSNRIDQLVDWGKLDGCVAPINTPNQQPATVNQADMF